MTPNGIKQAQINNCGGGIFCFLKGRVSRADSGVDETAFDEIIFAVDNAAETPRPTPVYVKMFMREDCAAFDYFKV